MPILPAEPDLHPTDLWERRGDGESGERWWCLHSKPRQEKAVARFLRSQDIAYYLPQVVKVDRTPQGRKIRSIIPLFPSYLFLWATSLPGSRRCGATASRTCWRSSIRNG